LFAAVEPGEVQNLRANLNPTEASLTLNWDLPNNVTTAGDVTTYDVHFKVDGGEGRGSYSVNAPATSIHLTRQSGLKPLTKYVFEVRAHNIHHNGRWNSISKYIGTCM